MKTLKIMLDYKCYPVWIYDESGNIEDSYLPDDLLCDTELKNLLDSIQERYNKLFLDKNGKEDFHTERDFDNEADKAAFYNDVNKAIKIMKDRYSDKYIIESDVAD